ncbi:MAG: DUF6364 family protein [Ignavibacteria bacterium]|jgi:hypothetical protein
MQTKLTLKLNKDSILRAKNYAYKNSRSLSKIVEDYFDNLTLEKDTKQKNVSKLVKELKGVISLPKNYNRKKDYTEYLFNKYK